MAEQTKDLLVSGDEMIVPVRLWSHDGDAAEHRRPLLVVHDGHEFDGAENEGHLTSLMGRWIRDGEIPAYNVALLSADDDANSDRLTNYGASQQYSDVLRHHVLPEIRRHAPTDGPTVGMGASMGALAMLYSADSFDGLFLQSTSSHHRDYHPEQDYLELYGAHGCPDVFYRVEQFVGEARARLPVDRQLVITMTCSTEEGNYVGNQDIFYRLREQGHTMVGVPVEGNQHHYDSWRSLVDPHLGDLLAAAVRTELHTRRAMAA